MLSEEFMNNLSEEVKQKLAGCKTQEEVKEVLAAAGIEPLDDDVLDGIAGGVVRMGADKLIRPAPVATTTPAPEIDPDLCKLIR